MVRTGASMVELKVRALKPGPSHSSLSDGLSPSQYSRHLSDGSVSDYSTRQLCNPVELVAFGETRLVEGSNPRIVVQFVDFDGLTQCN